MKKEYATLGELIKDARTKRGLTQKQIADAMHVVPQTVNKWETNENQPSIETLAAICGLLDISGNDVISVYRGEENYDDIVLELHALNDVSKDEFVHAAYRLAKRMTEAVGVQTDVQKLTSVVVAGALRALKDYAKKQSDKIRLIEDNSRLVASFYEEETQSEENDGSMEELKNVKEYLEHAKSETEAYFAGKRAVITKSGFRFVYPRPFTVENLALIVRMMAEDSVLAKQMDVIADSTVDGVEAGIAANEALHVVWCIQSHNSISTQYNNVQTFDVDGFENAFPKMLESVLLHRAKRLVKEKKLVDPQAEFNSVAKSYRDAQNMLGDVMNNIEKMKDVVPKLKAAVDRYVRWWNIESLILHWEESSMIEVRESVLGEIVKDIPKHLQTVAKMFITSICAFLYHCCTVELNRNGWKQISTLIDCRDKTTSDVLSVLGNMIQDGQRRVDTGNEAAFLYSADTDFVRLYNNCRGAMNGELLSMITAGLWEFLQKHERKAKEGFGPWPKEIEGKLSRWSRLMMDEEEL